MWCLYCFSKIPVQQIYSAFMQVNQSAHAHTQWSSQWYTCNLLQQYWWAILTCFYGAFLLIAHDVVQFLRSIAESISTSSITVYFSPASAHSENKLNRWLTVSCPPWSTCTTLWRIEKARTSWHRPRSHTWQPFGKKTFPLWHSTGPLKLRATAASVGFSLVLIIVNQTSKNSLWLYTHNLSPFLLQTQRPLITVHPVLHVLTTEQWKLV